MLGEASEEVETNLRSVTQSCKEGVPLDRLQRDYHSLIGEPIPYRNLGHKSLEDYIRSIPHVIHLSWKQGGLVAEAVADASTMHIANLISRQKTSKSSGRTRRPFRRGGPSVRYNSRGRGGSRFSSYSSYVPGGASVPRYGTHRDLREHLNTKRSQSSQETSNNREQPRETNHNEHPRETNHREFPRETNHREFPRETNHREFPRETNHTDYPRETNHRDAPQSRPQPPREPRPSTSRAVAPAQRKYTPEIAPRFLRLIKKTISQNDQPETNSHGDARRSSPAAIPQTIPEDVPVPHVNHHPEPSVFYEDNYAPPLVSFSSMRLSGDVEPPPVMAPRPSVGQRVGPVVRPSSPREASAPRQAVNLDALESAASCKEYIARYAKMLHLEVRYKTKRIGQKKTEFTSSLRLGEKTYITYPVTAPSIEAAEELAAKKAVDFIKENQANLPVLPATNLDCAEDITVLRARIEEIVLEKPSGMYTDGVKFEYEEKFQEALPPEWLTVVEMSTAVHLEELKLPGKVRCIICQTKSKSQSSRSTTPNSDSSSRELERRLSQSSLEDKPHRPKTKQLPLPEVNEWDIVITSVDYGITGRLVDLDEEFVNLTREMADVYSEDFPVASETVVGQLYAVEGRDDDDLLFHRVLVTAVRDVDWVECYFVDSGTYADILKSELKELLPKFYKFPYQAIHMTLEGLNDFETLISVEHLKFLVGKVCVAEVRKWNSPPLDYFPEDSAILKSIYSMVLYDTSEETDINLNQVIKAAILEPFTAKLPKPNTSSRGVLTHVTEDGEIYLRFSSPDNWFEASLEKLAPLFESSLPVAQPLFGKVYAVKHEGTWKRCILLRNQLEDRNMMEVQLIDDGPIAVVSREALYSIPQSEVLSILGPQTIRCNLFNALPSPDAKWTAAATKKLQSLASPTDELIIRVISEGDRDVLPKVAVHKREIRGGDSVIVSLNDSVAFSAELFEFLNGSVNSSLSSEPQVQSLLGNDVVNSSLLSPTNDSIEWLLSPDNLKASEAVTEELSNEPLSLPEVPNEDDLFNVFVCMAASPSNFVMQSLQCVKPFEELGNEMMSFYSNEENIFEMEFSLLKTGHFYAALHRDGLWYRARLEQIESTDPYRFLVYYVDYGEYYSLSLKELQVLYNQFRKLPCQAILGSLAGVKPVAQDWNAEDCLQFKSLVHEKMFVSVIRKKAIVEHGSFPMIKLDVMLIDTSDPRKDFHVDKYLISKKMACEA